MISVVGIGEFCCNIVDKLGKYNTYDVYKISNSIETCDNCFHIKVMKNAEEYESKCPPFEEFITDDNKEVSVFVDGSESISGVLLRFLESLKDRKINIYYIRSDLQLSSPTEILQNKICFNIVQEYARSGLFNSVYIIDKLKLEQIIGNVSLLEYENKLTELISSTIHMVNVYQNTKPVFTNTVEFSDITRIRTIGISSIGGKEIKWFFDLENISEMNYYFAINSNTLKKEQKLLQLLKKQVKEKQEENVGISFGVYETNYSENYVYCVGKSKIIQGQQSTA